MPTQTLRVRSNDKATLVLEHLDGADAVTWICETDAEATALRNFPVGAKVRCDLFIGTNRISVEYKGHKISSVEVKIGRPPYVN